MKIGIIREEKTPVDWRVMLSHRQLLEIKELYPQVEITVQSSDIRCFEDQRYIDKGFEVKDDISDCDVLLGVKEVPIDSLIPNKKYFFFSHTFKEQEYNRDLLKALLDKNIDFFDLELLKDQQGFRQVYFGKWAGVVGAYNGLRTLGKKFREFELPKAHTLNRKSDVENILEKLELPNIKVCLTGTGHVAEGAREILLDAKIKEVSPEDYLSKEYDYPVFVNIGCEHYVKRKDGGEFELQHFFDNPKDYESTFAPFTKHSDLYISGHYWDHHAPRLWEVDDMRSEEFKISVIADITCDIEGSVPSTLRASTVAEPNYGYNPDLGEIDFMDENAVAVMAVDNLPTELAKDSSENFGAMFIKNVLPALFNGDKDGILKSANMTKDGKLTEKYSYLKDFVSK